MKLVINLKLKPDASRSRALKDTLERCNEACNWLSHEAFESKVFGQYSLHKAHYRALRETFALTAQAAVRCIGKVADAYKLKDRKETRREFRKWAAQPYDDRIFRFAKKSDAINLWTLNGRQTIPFVCGDYQRKLLPFRKGEVDLLFVPYEGTRPIRGRWFITCIIEGDQEDLFPSDTELAYLSGHFDGEGCISMSTRGNCRIPRVQFFVTASYKPTLIAYKQWFSGTINRTHFTNKPLFQWQLGSLNEQIHFLELVAPFLHEKRKQADVVLSYLKERTQHHDRTRLPASIMALAVQTHAALKAEKLPQIF